MPFLSSALPLLFAAAASPAAAPEYIIPPMVILTVGIAIVLGMIIVWKINAFIALITAAIAVSLLDCVNHPAGLAVSIERVALAFGGAAGKIGIVIALAAVIGQCMMDSGAADRIVRAFMRLLGQKRAPWALMGSGYVLAIPVFFDTVFYLLVPLARSFYRRVGRNYLLCILAIAAGGAITHTLVPPTPGPLYMAEALGIDLGVMIGVGALVALPAAIVGVVFASMLDRRMDIPMRTVGDEEERPPLEDHELPNLFVSLLPVVLPVLLIAANTVLTTLADAEQAPRLTAADITDWPAFRRELTDAPPLSPGARITEALAARDARLNTDATALLEQDAPLSDDEKQRLAAALDELLAERDLYEVEAFHGTLMSAGMAARRLTQATDDDPANDPPHAADVYRRMVTAHALLENLGTGTKKIDIRRMNRLLLEASFPELVRPHTWDTPLREAATLSSQFGNANLALLISAAIALCLWYFKRRPSLGEMAQGVELALMSAGVIILITAAGSAFGAMLEVADIGPAIQDLFGNGGQSGSSEGAGLALLLLGFGIAALLKVAQGSSTAAMIVGSSMLAAMLTDFGPLPFHPVYLATAIGAGSLIGSWMNDSGFWIFAKMGGLTEMEALKSWTPLLVILGLTSFLTTVILSQILPLTNL